MVGVWQSVVFRNAASVEEVKKAERKPLEDTISILTHDSDDYQRITMNTYMFVHIKNN